MTRSEFWILTVSYWFGVWIGWHTSRRFHEREP